MLVALADQGSEALRRIDLATSHASSAVLQELAKASFAEDPAGWIDDWAWSYDPRQLDMPDLPFRLSQRQRELVTWLVGVVDRGEESVLEKGRDLGVSWIMALFALNRFLFVPGFKTTFGSYQADKVDHIGDPDSIFEKMRIAMDMLPEWQWPKGWDKTRHDNYMRFVNPENGNTVIGEVGKQIGRGGRSTLMIVDEAAFVEHFRSAARAVSANADAKVWASTANGMANGFYLKRETTRARDPSLVFRFHWRDDPRKTEAWATRQKAEMEPADWASEHDIDYGASVERTLIRAGWVEACRELGRRHRGEFSDRPTRCGLDVGAGKAESVLATMRGPAVVAIDAWRDPDAVDTASTAVDRAREVGAAVLNYDATGVGFGQGAIMKRLGAVKVGAINLGDSAPDDVKIDEGDKRVPASERFANLKAFGWWSLREAAKASWEVVEGVKDHPLDECLLLEVDDPVLVAQLSQPTWSKTMKGKRQVDKAPDGMKSPDRADAVVLARVEGKRGLPLTW